MTVKRIMKICIIAVPMTVTGVIKDMHDLYYKLLLGKQYIAYIYIIMSLLKPEIKIYTTELWLDSWMTLHIYQWTMVILLHLFNMRFHYMAYETQDMWYKKAYENIYTCKAHFISFYWLNSHIIYNLLKSDLYYEVTLCLLYWQLLACNIFRNYHYWNWYIVVVLVYITREEVSGGQVLIGGGRAWSMEP